MHRSELPYGPWPSVTHHPPLASSHALPPVTIVQMPLALLTVDSGGNGGMGGGGGLGTHTPQVATLWGDPGLSPGSYPEQVGRLLGQILSVFMPSAEEQQACVAHTR